MEVAEIGYGTWGMAGWSGSDDAESLAARWSARSTSDAISSTPRSPTAQATASGSSAALLSGWRGDHIYIATKVPPKNGRWPARADYRLEDVFPPITSGR